MIFIRYFTYKFILVVLLVFELVVTTTFRQEKLDFLFCTKAYWYLVDILPLVDMLNSFSSRSLML